METLIGLAIALALNQRFRGRALVRAAVFIPWAVPTVVFSAELWKSMFDPQSGLRQLLALPSCTCRWASTTWLDGNLDVVGRRAVADAWRSLPSWRSLLLAGLQVIPQDIYEAAQD